MTSLPSAVLCDLVLDLGLVAPTPHEEDTAWLDWWKRTSPAMDDSQRQHFFDALDLAPPYRIVVVDLCE
jgi:hypothetical protein